MDADSTVNPNRQRTFASAVLVLAAFLWGSGFIPQKLVAETMSALAFNSVRYGMATVLLFALARFQRPRGKREIFGVVVNGVLLFAAATLQQLGIARTTVGNTGFITALYIVLVPFLSAIFLKTKISRDVLAAASLAVTGLYLLTTGGAGLSRFSYGDLLVLIGAVFWALQILTMKRVLEEMDPLVYSAGQFAVCTLLNLIAWTVFEGADVSALRANLPPVIFSGVFVIAGGFTLQAYGMRHVDPARAATILGLESVFGMIFGMIIFQERPLILQAIGAALIFAAATIASRSETEPHPTGTQLPAEPKGTK